MTHLEPSPQPARPTPAGSFPNAWTLFEVRKVPIRLDRSWLIIAALVTFWLYQRLAVILSDHPPFVVLVLAAAGAILFSASILAHELGHALTSLDRQIPVVSITLFALGGVTESTREASRARDEFVIVGIGPFISLVLAAAFGLLHTLTAGSEALGALIGYLAWVNLALAIFNVIPGYPLDGGRLLRSIFWGVTGRPNQATRWAARVGQGFAALLIAVTLADYATSGRGLGSLWNALIGVFLFRGATDSYRRAQMKERMDARSVRELMGSVPPALPGDATLREAIEQVQQRPSVLWPVGNPVVGAVLLESIDAVTQDRWDDTTVAQIAYPGEQVLVDIATPLEAAVEQMIEAPHNMVIVTDDGAPVGLLTPSLVAELQH